MQKGIGKFCLLYLLNVIVSVWLVVIRSEGLIQCSIFVCLLPLIIVSTFFGISIVCMTIYLLQEES